MSAERETVQRSVSLPLLIALLTVTLTPATAVADYVGPAVVAKVDHRLWKEKIDSQVSFDKASRASILVYVSAVQDMQHLSDTEMLTSFKIKSINRPSVEKWLAKEYKMALLNYQLASASCTVNDWTCAKGVASEDDLLRAAADSKQRTPEHLLAWQENLMEFSRTYVSEQLRLAALFPKVSSEIDLFNDNEWNGDMFADRQFLLSFDDGPTGTRGNTDETLNMLKEEKKSAVFFVLGEHFQERLNKTNDLELKTLYRNQCVGLHGWEHKSHAKWEQWQNSIARTQKLLDETLPKSAISPLFRPPYGQRKEDSDSFFLPRSIQVSLWNLDSQDWNSHVSIDDISNRMITLMLIKRHGMLLFHDVHPKAMVALPTIFRKLGSSVDWGDCHQLNKSQYQ